MTGVPAGHTRSMRKSSNELTACRAQGVPMEVAAGHSTDSEVPPAFSKLMELVV